MASDLCFTTSVVLLLFLCCSHLCRTAEMVTAENYPRAESDTIFHTYAVVKNHYNSFLHSRHVADPSSHDIIRLNRDTLYSYLTFDASQGIEVHLPTQSEGDPQRYQSLQVINQDHYVKAVLTLAGSSIKLTAEEIGTPYGMILGRTYVDALNSTDLCEAHAAQDGLKASIKGTNPFVVPQWDQESLLALRAKFIEAFDRLPPNSILFGDEGEVPYVNHCIGTAAGWGGLPKENAVYEGIDIRTVPTYDALSGSSYSLWFFPDDIPISPEGFWSVSVYGEDGFFLLNPYDAYTLSQNSARVEHDGSVCITFASEPSRDVSNFLYIEGNSWNYVVRLYEPYDSVVKGEWTFPIAEREVTTSSAERGYKRISLILLVVFWIL